MHFYTKLSLIRFGLKYWLHKQSWFQLQVGRKVPLEQIQAVMFDYGPQSKRQIYAPNKADIQVHQ
ncbi:hypothetical protein BpHYR1_049582 [Brachionus plicatilis]|uniref:Uncharacterized protein n=1 Tax=Brachionus plicatilis TaxID=10195 RepID=A0A3M7SSW2_BRAPC|nr:hypothetical protein BpHYR1_049582 [Brachionus plicatilis]